MYGKQDIIKNGLPRKNTSAIVAYIPILEGDLCQKIPLPTDIQMEPENFPSYSTTGAWNIVNMLVSKGCIIKSVIEREYWKTSLVILERKV